MEFDDSSNTATHGQAQTDERSYQFKALTDLWTGSVDGKHDRHRLIATGLLGSIRWWFEVLVRGLGGSACDPTDTQCEGRNHCAVCELFGCTGWARKFRFTVLDENGKIKTDQIKQNQTFSLRFTPLRPIRIEEWTLLDTTLRLIAEYGAIGGKTVFKPSDEPERQGETHHQDFGLIELLKGDLPRQRVDIVKLRNYVCENKWKKSGSNGEDADFAWASFQHFWCVNGKHLGRQDSSKSTFNKVLGRNELKNQGRQLHNSATDVDRWLAGSQQESKKVFSFKKPIRTFGFVKPGLINLAEMKTRLQNAWPDLRDGEFREGPAILDNLLSKDDHS